jgi:hypothetical protein
MIRFIERATTGSLECSLGKRGKGGLGRGVERFKLADRVGFRLGLSMQPLHGRRAERGAQDYAKHQFISL